MRRTSGLGERARSERDHDGNRSELYVAFRWGRG
jgi:hypothetical protein